MYTQSQGYKAEWVLKHFSPRELQLHARLSMPTRITGPTKTILRKDGLYRQRTSQFFERTKEIPGTKISASLLHRIKYQIPDSLGRHYHLRELSIKKLSSFYDRWQYQMLRAKGANKEDARRYHKEIPDKLLPRLRAYEQWAHKIQNNHARVGRHVPLEAIKWGMAHSSHRYSEWNSIAQISGSQKKRHYPSSSRRSWKYEH